MNGKLIDALFPIPTWDFSHVAGAILGGLILLAIVVLYVYLAVDWGYIPPGATAQHVAMMRMAEEMLADDPEAAYVVLDNPDCRVNFWNSLGISDTASVDPDGVPPDDWLQRGGTNAQWAKLPYNYRCKYIALLQGTWAFVEGNMTDNQVRFLKMGGEDA